MISEAAGERRRQESDRHGGGEGGEEELVSGSDGLGKGGRWIVGVLGIRQGMSRWEDYHMVAVAEAGKRQMWRRRDIGRQEERVGRVQ